MAITTIGGTINSTAVTPNLDYKYGPYSSKQEAYNTLGPNGLDKLALGLTVGIIEDGVIREYWFRNSISSADDLVLKSEGKSAYDLYVESVPSGQTPMTEEEWLDSLKGETGDPGHNPNLGTYTISNYQTDAPTENIQPGDYISVIDDTDPSDVKNYIYTWNGTAWTNTNREVGSQFATEEYVSATSIINDLTTGGEHDVLSAEMGKELGKSVVYDISKANSGVSYSSLASALGTNGANIPSRRREGGMSIKFKKTIEATYSVVKTEGLENEPTGTELGSAYNLESGTYTESQLSGYTLPTTIGAGNALTYYFTITGDTTTYTSWVFTKLTDTGSEYEQYRYISSDTSNAAIGNTENWKSGEDQSIYDVTANNSGMTFASLSALLSDSNLSTLIPTNIRCGGMSIRFVQSSGNKYVQYRLMSDSFNTTPASWQGVDDEPTAGSDNLVESGGVVEYDKNRIIPFGQSPIGLNASIEYPGHIDNTNKIVSYGSASYIVIRVNGGDVITKPYIEYGFFVIVKDFVFNPELPYDFDFATGETGKRNNVTDLTLPSDAKYLLLARRRYNGDIISIPGLLSINGRCIGGDYQTFYSGEYLPTVSIENAPTKNSTSLLQSGGCFDFVKAIEEEINEKITFEIEQPVVLENYLSGQYVSSNGSLRNYSPAKVYYFSYTPGTKLKMKYDAAFNPEIAYHSWAIYSTNDINSVSYSNCLVTGIACSTLLEPNIEIDIFSDNSNAKILCITADSTHSVSVVQLEYEDVKEIVTENSERIQALERGGVAPARYSVNNDELLIAYPFSAVDMLWTLKKKGANSLFDFYKFSTIPHNSSDISTAVQTVITTINTDMHLAYSVRAVNNADGDNINPDTGDYRVYFTGGNHNYNNTGSGNYSATARGISLKFYVDGKEITSGQGSANQIKMVWTNLVQGYNTTKADGTGREILQENHVMTFENGRFDSRCEVIPLEDIYMNHLYGFASPINQYPNSVFVGGTNRGVYTGINKNSGNALTYSIYSYGIYGSIEMFIDPTYDIGNRSMLSGDNLQSGMFINDYDIHKAYTNLISFQELGAENHYFFRGGWIFRN